MERRGGGGDIELRGDSEGGVRAEGARGAAVALLMALAGGARGARAGGGGALWTQRVVQLPAKPRGCHVVTRELVRELQGELERFEVGLANFFLMHTSASLTINENASPDVPLDLNDALDRIAPEGNFYRHSDEGPDDMPAHVKSSLMGPSLTVPVGNGRLVLGTWQGLYLNEHRDYGGSRKVVVTIQGQGAAGA